MHIDTQKKKNNTAEEKNGVSSPKKLDLRHSSAEISMFYTPLNKYETNVEC